MHVISSSREITFIPIVSFLVTFVHTIPIPQAQDPPIVTVIRDERNHHSGNNGEYSYAVELSDGTILEQRSINVNQQGSLSITGRYSFVDPVTGIKHEVEYIADERGYRPQVSHSKSSKNEVPSIEGTEFGMKIVPKPSKALVEIGTPNETLNKNIGHVIEFDNVRQNTSSEPQTTTSSPEIQETTPSPSTTTTQRETTIIPQQTIGVKPVMGIEESLVEEMETTPLPPLETIAASIFSSFSEPF